MALENQCYVCGNGRANVARSFVRTVKGATRYDVRQVTYELQLCARCDSWLDGQRHRNTL